MVNTRRYTFRVSWKESTRDGVVKQVGQAIFILHAQLPAVGVIHSDLVDVFRYG